MLILVNPLAGGGKTLQHWTTLEPLVVRSNASITCTMNGTGSAEQRIREALDHGETDYLAVGGDGTVNRLLNILMNSAGPDVRRNIRLGAIGLGSSNDFHKPLRLFKRMNGYPAKWDFTLAEPRDIGIIHLEDNGSNRIVYFLSNASVGVTAEANHRFNHPATLLQWLKKTNTQCAIMYAAVTAIGVFRSIEASVRFDASDEIQCRLSNLAVIKNPFVSGNFCFPVPPAYRNGRCEIYLHTGMTRMDLLALAGTLRKGRVSAHDKLIHCSAKSVSVESSQRFAVEFDGEVAMTRKATFGIIPSSLKVCR